MTQLAEILVRQLQPPDIVVVVEASADRILARRTSRNRVADLFTPESIRADIAMVIESVKAIEHIKQVACPFLRVVRVSTEEDGAETAIAAVVSVIEYHLADQKAIAAAGSGN